MDTQRIERAKLRTLTCYKEEHHIVPVCMNGDNSKENLVKLTAKEHFICHLLLTKVYPNDNKLKYALWCMMTLTNKHLLRYKITSQTFEKLRIECAKAISTHLMGHEVSENQKEKQRLKMTGRVSGFKDKHHSQENKEKARVLSTGRNHTEEWKQKESERKQKEKNPFYNKTTLK